MVLSASSTPPPLPLSAAALLPEWMQVGPNCEREFGAANLLDIMTWTGIVSGVAHMIFGPANAFQLGASGVVFMLM